MELESKSGEIRKPIIGYEGLYEVSNLGRVRSYPNKSWSTTRILKPWSNTDGYLLVDLCKDKKVSHKRVNRLVAEAFIPNPYNLPEVGHKDEAIPPINNRAENLYWTDRKENSNTSKHKERIATSFDGSGVVRNKCRVVCNGEEFESIRSCAISYNINYKTMWNWLSGKCSMPVSFIEMGLKRI